MMMKTSFVYHMLFSAKANAVFFVRLTFAMQLSLFYIIFPKDLIVLEMKGRVKRIYIIHEKS